MKILFGIIFGSLVLQTNINAAEAGMPQLDPEFWASQAFWLILVFTSLYLIISKIFIPKIKNGLEDRENKIKDDLDNAKSFKENADIKQKDYDLIMNNAKKEVQKILFESRNKLTSDIQLKKKKFENEIDKEIKKVQEEILNLKRDSIQDVEKISTEITSNIIENISGDKLNESSIKAAISQSLKENLGKYL
ncbi:MAG: hypothetical protein ACJZ4O_03155 [Pelagibacteraceae bacterium]